MLSREELDRLYPIGQATHTGKWGWRRVNGCLNLNSCCHDTREQAEQDRDDANKRDDLGSR